MHPPVEPKSFGRLQSGIYIHSHRREQLDRDFRIVLLIPRAKLDSSILAMLEKHNLNLGFEVPSRLAGDPGAVALSFVLLSSSDSPYKFGQVLRLRSRWSGQGVKRSWGRLFLG